MEHEAADADGAPCFDIRILFPEDGVIRVESAQMFADPDGPLCRRFIECAFQAPEIEGVLIGPAPVPAIELQFDAAQRGQRQVLDHVAALLMTDNEPDPAPSNGGVAHHRPASALCADDLKVPPACTARDRHGVVRYHRYARRVTGWRVVSQRMGMIKLENPVLYRKAALCEAIERELMSLLGIDRYETSARTGSAKIEYDPRLLGPAQIIEILDGVLANAEHPEQLDKPELDLAICTASVPIAAVAQFAMPALLPVSAALFAYTTIPSFRGLTEFCRKSGGWVSMSSIRSSCWVASPRFTCFREPFSPGACLSDGFWCAVPRIARRSSCSGLLANNRVSSG